MNPTTAAATASLLLLLFLGSMAETPGTAPTLRGLGLRKLNEPGSVPELLEDWELIPNYPIFVGEAQGTMIENDLVVVGGFFRDFDDGTKEVYMLNLKDHYDGKQDADWVKMDDCPIDPFWTHAAHAVKGTQLFLCGGYLGPNPGPEMKDCYVFDKSKSPGSQWTEMPSLPEGRGGGAMVFVESMNMLVFALGAERPEGLETTVDKENGYMLDLSDPNAVWVELPTKSPYKGNHASAIDAKDCSDNHHYYWLGGQEEENEQSGNIDFMYEYMAETDSWVQRANLPQGTGHVTSSTVAFGCGFIILGGAVDGDNLSRRIKTDDVYYYDIPTDQWTHLGNYAAVSSTPVCGIYLNKLYCASGYRTKGWRSTITFPGMTLPPAPTSAPTPTPLWTNYTIMTTVKDGDFCPDATMRVRLEVAGEDLEGVTVTLKNEELGIDLASTADKNGRAIFDVTIADPSLSGQYMIEGCAFDAGGTAYCDDKRVELSCAFPTTAPINELTSAPTSMPNAEPSATPSQEQSSEPSKQPSAAPTQEPTAAPTTDASSTPTQEPTATPTEEVSTSPSQEPSTTPTPELSSEPSKQLSTAPTQEPTWAPIEEASASPSHEPTAAATEELAPAPLWNDVFIRTKVREGNFCPDATMVVRLAVAGEALKGVPVTLKNDELGIDLSGATNKRGRAKFAVSITDPSLSGKFVVEGCVYDAGGTPYCDTKKVELLC